MNSAELSRNSGSTRKRGRPPKRPQPEDNSKPCRLPEALPLRNKPGKAVDLAGATLVGIIRNSGLWSAVEIQISPTREIEEASISEPDKLQMAMAKAAQSLVVAYRRGTKS